MNNETLTNVSVVLNENDVKKYSFLKKIKNKNEDSSTMDPEKKNIKIDSNNIFCRRKKKLSSNKYSKKSHKTARNQVDYEKDTKCAVSKYSYSSQMPFITTSLTYNDHHILRNNLNMYSQRTDLKYKHLYFVNESNPGGCTSLHCYQDDLNNLSPTQYEEFVNEFMKLVFEERSPKVPNHVLGVIHNSGWNIPDLVEKMADDYPDLIVKRTLMGKSDVESLKLSDYRQLLHSSYSNGTFRCGPLLQVSLVGATSEECGDYFPSILDLLESNLFVKKTLPWGDMSCLEGMDRNHSNDGPIMWCRFGEQVMPTQELPKSPKIPKKRGINELKNLHYLPRGGESRELLIEDRTKFHADQVGDILDKKTTAAVGILKASHAKNSSHSNRIVKEVICIDPASFDYMVGKLKLDLHEPPMTQVDDNIEKFIEKKVKKNKLKPGYKRNKCISWMDESRLNQLHRQNIKTSTIQLRDNDIYFIPRNVIHQFRTITACTSVAWHLRLKYYHKDGGCGCGRHDGDNRDVPSEEEKNVGGNKIKKSLAHGYDK